MGVSIIHDSKRSMATIYCNTADWSLGPVFWDLEEGLVGEEGSHDVCIECAGDGEFWRPGTTASMICVSCDGKAITVRPPPAQQYEPMIG